MGFVGIVAWGLFLGGVGIGSLGLFDYIYAKSVAPPKAAEEGNWLSVNSTNYAEVVIQGSLEQAVIVEVFADWCEYCRKQRPRLEALSREYGPRLTYVQVNVDANPSITKQLRVKALPTVLIYRQGLPVERFEGVVPTEILGRVFREAAGAEREKGT
jgi:thioredoxin-like negative regulator of GroEL